MSSRTIPHMLDQLQAEADKLKASDHMKYLSDRTNASAVQKAWNDMKEIHDHKTEQQQSYHDWQENCPRPVGFTLLDDQCRAISDLTSLFIDGDNWTACNGLSDLLGGVKTQLGGIPDPSVLPIIVDSLGKSLEPLRAVIPISSLLPETADKLPPARLGLSDAEAVRAVMPALQQLQNAATFSGQLDEVLQTLYTQGEKIPQGATLTRTWWLLDAYTNNAQIKAFHSNFPGKTKVFVDEVDAHLGGIEAMFDKTAHYLTEPWFQEYWLGAEHLKQWATDREANRQRAKDGIPSNFLAWVTKQEEYQNMGSPDLEWTHDSIVTWAKMWSWNPSTYKDTWETYLGDYRVMFTGYLGRAHACLRLLYPMYSNIQRARENEAVLQPFHDHTKAVFDAIVPIQAYLQRVNATLAKSGAVNSNNQLHLASIDSAACTAYAGALQLLIEQIPRVQSGCNGLNDGLIILSS